MQLLGLALPKIPKVLCYIFYLLFKKSLQHYQCKIDFKFDLFHTKVSSSLRSSNLRLHLFYQKKKNLSKFNEEVLHREQLNFSLYLKLNSHGENCLFPQVNESQRYSSSYLEICGDTLRMASTVESKSIGTQDIFQNNPMPL